MTRRTNSLSRKTIPWIVATIILVVGTIASYLLYSTCIIFRDDWTLEVRPFVATATIATLSHITISYYQNNRQLRLFPAIVFWVLLGLTAYTILSAIWSNHETSFSDYLFAGWHSLNTNKLEQVKVTLTAIGGIGGVSFLVIKYRQQDIAEKQYRNDEQERTNAEEIENNRKFEAEKAEADKKLVDAVQQLGDQSPQVRIAGVYALADVADTYGSEGYGIDYNKRVVEILCGYLRTDRLPRDKNGETHYPTKTGEYSLSADGPVESAILSIIADHLQRTPTTKNDTSNGTARPPWSFYRIDLHDATLTEQVYFTDCQFWQLDLRRTTFIDRVVFSRSHFTGAASFEYATFKKAAKYDQVLFDFHTSFRGAIFEREAFFDQAEFRATSNFKEARFANTADFSSTHFVSEPEFDDTTPNQET